MSRVTKPEGQSVTTQPELSIIHSREGSALLQENDDPGSQQQEWRAGFEAMGRDPDTNNVEYALPAAREVLCGD